jgi:hypothetical protein
VILSIGMTSLKIKLRADLKATVPFVPDTFSYPDPTVSTTDWKNADQFDILAASLCNAYDEIVAGDQISLPSSAQCGSAQCEYAYRILCHGYTVEVCLVYFFCISSTCV